MSEFFRVLPLSFFPPLYSTSSFCVILSTPEVFFAIQGGWLHSWYLWAWTPSYTWDHPRPGPLLILVLKHIRINSYKASSAGFRPTYATAYWFSLLRISSKLRIRFYTTICFSSFPAHLSGQHPCLLKNLSWKAGNQLQYLSLPTTWVITLLWFYLLNSCGLCWLFCVVLATGPSSAFNYNTLTLSWVVFLSSVLFSLHCLFLSHILWERS